MRRLILLTACCALVAGCASDDQPRTNTRQRQDQALKDPFNYSPNAPEDSVGGGGTLDFKKDAFKRDMQHVFDP